MSKNRYIPNVLRQEVAELAGFRCEYCRRPEEDSFFKFQIDHIISLKHGGSSTLENLAFRCPICNANKGTDLGAILDDEDVVVRLFHPRKQNWFDHFEVSKEGGISSKTDIGKATIKSMFGGHPLD